MRFKNAFILILFIYRSDAHSLNLSSSGYASCFYIWN